MRDYYYRVDRDGHIFHDGSEIVDPLVLRFFVMAMKREPDGRYLVLCQGEQNWFEADDVPLVVQRLGLAVEAGVLRGVELRFVGDYRERLDPTTLTSDGGSLLCRVRRGALPARFGRIAMQQLAPFLAADGRCPVLLLDGGRYPIAKTQRAGS